MKILQIRIQELVANSIEEEFRILARQNQSVGDKRFVTELLHHQIFNSVGVTEPEYSSASRIGFILNTNSLILTPEY